MSDKQQIESVIQQCIKACADRGYASPYDVTITGEHGTRLGWHVDGDGACELAGDIGSAGEIEIGSTYVVHVTDAKLRPADFRVTRLERVDGTPLPPIITTPPEWDGN